MVLADPPNDLAPSRLVSDWCDTKANVSDCILDKLLGLHDQCCSTAELLSFAFHSHVVGTCTPHDTTSNTTSNPVGLQRRASPMCLPTRLSKAGRLGAQDLGYDATISLRLFTHSSSCSRRYGVGASSM